MTPPLLLPDDWGGRCEVVCVQCGHVLGAHSPDGGVPFLEIEMEGTHRHAAVLNEDSLDVYRDVEVQAGEEKLKLRCPNHHKVGSILEGTEPSAGLQGRSLEGAFWDQRRVLLVSGRVASPLWVLVQRRDGRLCRDNEDCATWQAALHPTVELEGRKCLYFHVPEAMQQRYRLETRYRAGGGGGASTRPSALHRPSSSSTSPSTVTFPSAQGLQGGASRDRPALGLNRPRPDTAVPSSVPKTVASATSMDRRAASSGGTRTEDRQRTIPSQRRDMTTLSGLGTASSARPLTQGASNARIGGAEARGRGGEREKGVNLWYLSKYAPVDDKWVGRVHAQREEVASLLKNVRDTELLAVVARLAGEAWGCVYKSKVEGIITTLADSNALMRKLCTLAASRDVRMSVQNSQAFLRLLQFAQTAGASVDEELLQSLRASQDSLTGTFANAAEQHGRQQPSHTTDVLPDEEEMDLSTLSVLPTKAELLADTKERNRSLPTNHEGPWRRLCEYVDCHFRLLREDYVAPLREVLTHFLRREPRARYVIYAMQVTGPVLSPAQPLTFHASFSLLNRRQPRHVFAHDSRLKFGSLLALLLFDEGKNDVAEVLFASVASYKREEAIDGRTTLSFEPSEASRLRPNVQYIAIESPAYFLAFAHVLSVLRQPDTLRLNPLSPVLLTESVSSSQPPPYLLCPQGIDVSPLVDGDSASTRLLWHPNEGPLVCLLENLGLRPQCPLNDSQLQAVEHCLTHTVALVVGPPGTGKSYTGVQVARLLLHHLRGSAPSPGAGRSSSANPPANGPTGPLLVVTYTNHALDQLLTDLYAHFPDLLRCGAGDMRRRQGQKEEEEGKGVRLQTLYESARLGHEEYHARQRLQKECGRLNTELHSLLSLREQSRAPGPQLLDLLSSRSSALRTLLFKPRGPPGLTRSLLALRQGGYVSVVKEAMHAWASGEEGELQATWRAEVRRAMQDERQRAARGGQEIKGVNRYAMLATEWGDDEEQDLDVEEEEEDEEEEGISETFRRLYMTAAGTLPPMVDEEQEEGEGEIDMGQEGGDLGQMEGEEAVEGQDGEDGEEAVEDEEGDWNDLTESDLERLLQGQSQAQQGEGDKGQKQTGLGLTADARELLDQVVMGAVLPALPQDTDAGPASIWGLPLPARRNVLQAVRQGLKSACLAAVEGLTTQLQKVGEELEEIRAVSWVRASRGRPIVGLTSTFAAQHMGYVRALRPTVVLVEEAGELLESQLMAAVASPALQHLIQFGDHKQLRPKLNHHKLEQRRLDVSLFERLVESDGQRFHKAMLQVQLRMRPEISDLTRFSYTPPVTDHPSVKQFPPIRGLASSVFFLTHSLPEDRVESDALLLSKSHSAEARFLCYLGSYLTQQGYAASDLAFLSGYLGQVRLLRRLIREKFPELQGARINTIDNFQGEESRVVLLSLVRSNTEREVGFTKTENRAIVSLSRAREGFFIVGNGTLLQPHEAWRPVITLLKERGWYAEELPLCCDNHQPAKTTLVKVESEGRMDETLAFMRHGGCKSPCDALLPCGHGCPLPCHKQPHASVRCTKPCALPQVCEHGCPLKRCHGNTTPCDPCRRPVPHVLPSCGHRGSFPCDAVRNDPGSLQCRERVAIELPCGHSVMAQCHTADAKRQAYQSGRSKCTEPVPLQLACGHTTRIPCHDHASPSLHATVGCKEACARPLHCGHPCASQCSGARAQAQHEQGHQCAQPCRVELICGHDCQAGCSQPHTSRCARPCEVRCAHNKRCTRRCSERCVPCVDPCHFECKHSSCTRKCHEPCDREPCHRRCSEVLECAHRCMGLCGEWPCPPCPLCNRQLAGETEVVTQQTFRDLFTPRAESENAWKAWRRARLKQLKRKPAGPEAPKPLPPPSLDLKESGTLYRLPDCGCVFLTESLDAALLAQMQLTPTPVEAPGGGGHRGGGAAPHIVQRGLSSPQTSNPSPLPAGQVAGCRVGLLRCPTCRVVIFTAARYERQAKHQLALYQRVKARLAPLPEGCEDLRIDHEAMAEVLETGGLAAGSWFACGNGHPYRIEPKDPSAPTQHSAALRECPECKGFVGASRGVLQAGNRFLKIDASEPAFTGHGMKAGMPLPPISPGGVVREEVSGPVGPLKEHWDWVTGYFKELFPSLRVSKVEVIGNAELVARYDSRKRELLRWHQRGAGGGAVLVEERLVYHGTAAANHEPIVKEGLRVGGRGVHQAHGAAFGEGIYLGANPAVAQGYARGTNAFLFCRVLMGRATKDCNDYTARAGRDWDSYDGDGFCVVYREDQVLPCYIVRT